MQASPGGLIGFIALVILSVTFWGTTALSTGFFVLMFALYVPAYFGLLYLVDWLLHRNDATRR